MTTKVERNRGLVNPYGLIPKLLQAFEPSVRKIVGPLVEGGWVHPDLGAPIEARYGVKYVENLNTCAMFHFIVELLGRVEVDVLNTIGDELQRCLGANEDPPIKIVLPFTLGDGDDSLAVWYEAGAFHIWLRGWYEGYDE